MALTENHQSSFAYFAIVLVWKVSMAEWWRVSTVPRSFHDGSHLHFVYYQEYLVTVSKTINDVGCLTVVMASSPT